MIWNLGELPPNWTLEKLLGKHASIPFNPGVANVFFRAGMIEAWGRGIERIVEACREAGSPEPEVTYETTGLWVTFLFPEALQVPTTQARLGKGLGERLGETRAAIVRAMLDNPAVTTLLAGALKISTTAVEKQLQILKAQGYIERVGSARGGHWKVKETV